VPAPPVIDPAIVRLTQPGDGLDQAFINSATAAKMHVDEVAEANLDDAILGFLRSRQLTRIMLTRCPLFTRVNLIEHLRGNGIDARYWDEMTLDEGYDVDAGVTEVYRAVAETGSLIVRESRFHGRAASLLPMVHVAVVERWQIVPDLIDLMELLAKEQTGSGVVMITGPSKTADIEMNLVVGVHGPGEVQVFLV
jgi:L-lactate dehydrogenase complex protein LldG